MATLVAKNPPVGVPPGVKVLNDQQVATSQPESCIMATAVGVDCGSAFQTHKRYKVLMKPDMIDGIGSDSVDLVFRAGNSGDAVEEYRVFQKIRSTTGPVSGSRASGSNLVSALARPSRMWRVQRLLQT